MRGGIVSLVLRAAGHVGAFAGMYVAGAMVCVWQLGGLEKLTGRETPSIAALTAVLLIATGTYALDRVKVRTSWMDPSDRVAQPERYAFLDAQPRRVRYGAAIGLIIGAGIGCRVHWLAPVAAALAAIGVIAYAPRARKGTLARARIKDHLGIKNLYVAAGITSFATVAAVADAASRPAWSIEDVLGSGWSGLLAASALVGFRVMCEAAICDLDDETADRMHGTRTLPTVVGGRAAWKWTGLARVLLPVATLACVWCPWRARVVWAVVGMLGVLAMRVRRPRKVRDLVDVRLAIESVVASAALLTWDIGAVVPHS